MNPANIVLPLVMFCISAILAIRARDGKPLSKRLAALSTSIAVAGFIPTFLGHTLRSAEHQSYLFLCAAIILLCNFSSLLLVIFHFIRRSRDGKGGLGYALSTIPLMIITFLNATGFLLISLQHSNAGTPWTWPSPQDGFSVQLPNSRWQLAPDQQKGTKFICPLPVQIASVADVIDLKERDFNQIAQGIFAKFTQSAPAEIHSERTPEGLECRWMLTTEKSKDDESYLLGVSLTQKGQKAVLLFYEGHHSMTSRLGREKELETFQAHGKHFLTSVK